MVLASVRTAAMAVSLRRLQGAVLRENRLVLRSHQMPAAPATPARARPATVARLRDLRPAHGRVPGGRFTTSEAMPGSSAPSREIVFPELEVLVCNAGGRPFGPLPPGIAVSRSHRPSNCQHVAMRLARRRWIWSFVDDQLAHPHVDVRHGGAVSDAPLLCGRGRLGQSGRPCRAASRSLRVRDVVGVEGLVDDLACAVRDA